MLVNQVDEAPSLFPELREVAPPPGQGLHGYWKRPDNGWVVVAATGRGLRQDFEYKGMVFMPQYGEFDNGTGTRDAEPSARDAKGMPWNPAIEPWRLILQRGGAKEFPISQIIAFRWHVKPPYRGLVFPQLEGVTIETLYCPECERGVFASEDPQEAADLLRQHLTSGVNDQHSYRPEDFRALGKEYNIDFFAARKAKRPLRRVGVSS